MRAQLNGYVVADSDAEVYRYFGYSVCCPNDIRNALANTPAGDTLTLEINSGGGSMFSGYEMYSVLRASEVTTEAEIQSIAGSAMSVAICGFDTVKASPVAQVMIHDPSIVTTGDSTEHQKSITALDSFVQSVLNVYQLKCKDKTSRDELRSMMQAESWLDAKKAMETGFVDSILYDDEGIIANQVVMCAQNGIRAMMNTLPDVTLLRKQMENTKNPDLAFQSARLKFLSMQN